MNWMTLKEIADYLKLSRMMVYKLCQQGRMPASKIGRVWRFEKSAVDEWLRGTNKPAVAANSVDEILADFAARLKKSMGDNLKRIVIFGSQARGDAENDSDIDVLVVLKNIEDYQKSRTQVESIAYDCTYGVGRPRLLSPIIVNEKEYLTGLSPLMLNVRRSGQIYSRNKCTKPFITPFSSGRKVTT